MPHLHFRRTVYKSGGTAAVARVDYITRADAQVTYITGQREDLVASGTRNLPVWAPDAVTYFAAAEQYEGGGAKRRYNAFEEWKITLPQELTREQNLVLIDDLLACIVGDSMPCTWGFHAPLTLDGTAPQPHIHLLLSTRHNDGHVRSPVQHFQRWNAKAPAQGGAQKDRLLRAMGAVKAQRLMISDVLNLHLELHGKVGRVHPDSLVSRGIAREPEPKLLPSESAAFREDGVVGKTLAKVLGIRAIRASAPPHEQNNARQYWEQRKAFLGITRDMDREAQLAQLLVRRHGGRERIQERRQRQHTPSLATQLRALTAQFDHEAQGYGRRLRVRLHEEEHTQGYG
jgi:MobA/MobL family